MGEAGRPLKEAPAGDKWGKHSIKLLDSTWEELSVYAIRNKTTVSDLLQKLASEFIEKQNRE